MYNRTRIARAAALACVLAPLAAGTAVTTATAAGRPQGPPPPPKAAGGAKVTTVARGVPTPTQFAFGGGTAFVAGAGAEDGSAAGGIYVLGKGRARRIRRSPRSVFGLAWSAGTLYLSSGPAIFAATGWDGSGFDDYRRIYRGPDGFTGFNGIAIGPDGRLYAGVTMGERGDARRVDAPYAQSIVSMTTDGEDVRAFATGLRQPWMLTFAPGVETPLATALGQENLGRQQPPDYVIAPQDGDDFGFPSCNWSKPAACAEFARPLSLLPAHSSPMGIGVIGETLYLALFTGTGRGPQVVSQPLSGGTRTTPVLSGFAAPVVALGTHKGSLWAGDLTGAIYTLKPRR